jgi:Flavodoxins
MKTLVIYYSYSGHTKVIAEKIAIDEAADVSEIKDIKRPGVLKAYSAGCFTAIKGKAWPIASLAVDLTVYDHLIFLSPIWAGNVPPAVNAFLELLPEGKSVSVKLISGSGKSGCKERLEAAIKAKNCTTDSIEDIKS